MQFKMILKIFLKRNRSVTEAAYNIEGEKCVLSRCNRIFIYQSKGPTETGHTEASGKPEGGRKTAMRTPPGLPRKGQQRTPTLGSRLPSSLDVGRQGLAM